MTSNDQPGRRPWAGCCRSCGAGLIWARSASSGKAMPLDVDPDPDGNLTLTDGTARVLAAGEQLPPGVARYTSHFATCPDSSAWRRS